MLPLGDDNPLRRFPFVNWLLVLANVAAFVYEMSFVLEGDAAIAAFVTQWGCVPSRLLSEPGFWQIATIFTSMFLHGGILHLIGNMWFLLIFGDNVEDRLGHFPYLCFYFLCGLGAEVVEVMVNPHSSRPSIGASGCVAGILGAYMVLFPNARVRIFNPILSWGFLGAALAAASRTLVVRIPAIFFLGIWFAYQWLCGYLEYQLWSGEEVSSGVAWWAHVGGFITGLMAVVLPQRSETAGDQNRAVSDLRVQAGIESRWNPSKRAFEQVVPGQTADEMQGVPGGFWLVKAAVTVIFVAVLTHEVIQFKPIPGDWQREPSIVYVGKVATLPYGLNLGKVIQMEASRSISFDSTRALWLLNYIVLEEKPPARQQTTVRDRKRKGRRSHKVESATRVVANTGAWVSLEGKIWPPQALAAISPIQQKALFTPQSKGILYQLLDGALIEGRLYVLANRMREGKKAPLAQGNFGVDMIQVLNPKDPPAKWTATARSIPLSSAIGRWGLSCLYHDGYLYVYGAAAAPAKQQASPRIVLARIDGANLKRMHLSAFEILTRGNSREMPVYWGVNSSNPATVCAEGNMDLTVRWVDAMHGLIATYSEGSVILVRYAKGPAGPWSRPLRIYTGAAGPKGRSSALRVSAHPELGAGPAELAITYQSATGPWSKASIHALKVQLKAP